MALAKRFILPALILFASNLASSEFLQCNSLTECFGAIGRAMAFRYLNDNLDLFDRYVLYPEEHAEEERMQLEELGNKIEATKVRMRLKARRESIRRAAMETNIREWKRKFSKEHGLQNTD